MKRHRKLYHQAYAQWCRWGPSQSAIGLALLLVPIVLWERLLPFACCRILGLIAIISSLGIVLQQRRSNQQLQQQLKAQLQVEQLLQDTIHDLELAVGQREQAQIDLAHKAMLLQSFLEASPDLLYYCNESNQFSDCNRAMELLTGKSQQQIIGLTPEHLYNETIAQREIETNQQLFQTNRPLTYEQWLPYPDGQPAYFEIRKVPFYDRIKQQRGLLGFGRDITEHKNSQLALEQTNQSKTHFMATISHELRTPLSGIVGLSRLLREEQLERHLQKRYLKSIYLSALTLNCIFNDIISLDKVEQHKITLMAEPLRLSDLLEELEDLGQVLVDPKGLTFTLQSAEGLPEFLVVDGTRLRQILWNLLSNAVKFTVQGGVILRIYQDSPPTARLTVEVIDSGMGIADSEQSKIFAMYYQAQPGLNNPTGAGIGLALSRDLAEIMGGSLSVQSQLGQGSCFTLCLPQPPLAQRSTPHPPPPAPSLHLLLIEDMEINITVAKTIIEKLGHTVDVVMSGAQALARFSPNQYQLILLDLQLPDMSGFEVVKQLRATYPVEQLPPLVALTANVLADNNQYLSYGLDAVLNKPLSLEALAAFIEFHSDTLLKNSISQTSFAILPEAVTPILDEASLNDYLGLLGRAGFTDNIALFEKILPTYLRDLKQDLNGNHVKALQAIAHKIQSACGTVGLQRLQQLALKIQQANLPQEWHQVKLWVNELQHGWSQDVQHLHQWLAKT